MLLLDLLGAWFVGMMILAVATLLDNVRAALAPLAPKRRGPHNEGALMRDAFRQRHRDDQDPP